MVYIPHANEQKGKKLQKKWKKLTSRARSPEYFHNKIDTHAHTITRTFFSQTAHIVSSTDARASSVASLMFESAFTNTTNSFSI